MQIGDSNEYGIKGAYMMEINKKTSNTEHHGEFKNLEDLY